jgi:hypothetical protein
METIEKIDVAKMKADIKAMVELQKFYKNQRKTVHIVGERKLEARDATYKHMANREDLRMMYAAYGLARGKTFSQIESRCSEENHPLKNHPLKNHQRTIDRILEKYKVLVQVETQVV